MHHFCTCACSALAVSIFAGSVSAGTGNQLFKLLPDNGAADDEFGTSVGVSGSIAVVGSLRADNGASNTGAAYLFDVVTGLQMAQLVSAATDANDQFGGAVAISGQTAVVGAQQNNVNGSGAGTVYVFSTATGALIHTLLANDTTGSEAFDLFGGAVGIDGQTVVIGAVGANSAGAQAGAAYIFDAMTGMQSARIAPASLSAGDRFGGAVAISGDIAVIGAVGDDENGSNAGAAYIYHTITQSLTRITPDDAQAGDEFGSAVAIDDGIAIIGAQSDDDNGSQAGSAYVYDTATGQFLFKLLTDDGISNDRFGASASISGTTAVVGAFATDGAGGNSGSAYLFDTTTGLQFAQITADDAASNDEFGTAVAIDGDSIVIGAHEDTNANGSDAGAAYAFGASSPPCLGDCDDSGTINFNDLVSMLFEFGNPTPSDECNADGVGIVDFNDLVATLFLFGPCP